ncbi:uncharacterized protein [Nicotiana sylvestris]|uniref:uncharacterized protein n=1 Tax=Nicotiana sylvestris TaxID=4096 RepID=UPI00388CC1F9
MVQGSRQWHEKLPFALLGYHTIVRTSIGATPYFMVYGTQAVIPAKVKISFLQIIAEAEIDDDKWDKTRLEQLSLINEKILVAVCHGQLYQRRMARAYNKKVSSDNQSKVNSYHDFAVLDSGFKYLNEFRNYCCHFNT